eukprot:3262654-Amphidinium_carterae.1
MQTSINQFAVKSVGVNAMEPKEGLARQRQSCAEHLGLTWPIPPKCKNVVGRPSRQDQFTRLLYAALRENQFPLFHRLSSSTVPAWYRRGMNLTEIEGDLAKLEKVALTALDKAEVECVEDVVEVGQDVDDADVEEADVGAGEDAGAKAPPAKKRKKAVVPRPVQLFFLSFRDRMKKSKGETVRVVPTDDPPDNTCLDHSPSRWQAVSTLLRLMGFIQGRIGGSPWLLLLDHAPIHASQ